MSNGILGHYGMLVGVSLSPAQLIINAMDNEPSNDRKALITDTYNALDAAGIWSKADVICFRAAADLQAALLDWKRLINALAGGDLVVDAGIKDTAGSEFRPDVDGVNYQLDSCCVATMISGHTSGNGIMIEIQPGGGGGYTSLYRGTGTNNSSFEVNSNAFPGELATIADPNGLWILQRTASNAVEMYRNNSLVASSSISSAGLPELELIQRTAGDPNALNVFLYAGAPLDSTERAALETIVNNYLAGL